MDDDLDRSQLQQLMSSSHMPYILNRLNVSLSVADSDERESSLSLSLSLSLFSPNSLLVWMLNLYFSLSLSLSGPPQSTEPSEHAKLKRTSTASLLKTSSTSEQSSQPSKDDFNVVKLISNGAYGYVIIADNFAKH